MGELEEYLAVAPAFKLGELLTESSHPLSRNLSEEAKQDLYQAIGTLKSIDVLALEKFREKADDIASMADAVKETLDRGYDIYLCGCGATGRLSLSLEVLCREGMIDRKYKGRVIGFMSGGDTALIKSIESFEDHPEYGEWQLKELGYRDGDLLISTTEGGETSFVIGATEYAAKVSKNKPWFLYCNPDEQLIAQVERSRRVIENPDINKISLVVGPMAIAGSTRMQASTVLMDAVGIALCYGKDPRAEIEEFRGIVEDFDFSFLRDFIMAEERIYRNKEHIIYRTDNFGITVLTDTTERAPTFSLAPFENYRNDTDPVSLTYLMMDGARNAKSAWRKLLHRRPRCLEWDFCMDFAGKKNFYGFDISEEIRWLRRNRIGQKPRHVFEVMDGKKDIRLRLGKLEYDVPKQGSLLSQHLLLKLVLNTHSTLIMGRLGRYEGNLMTYVRPSCNKLIDRSIRYVRELYERRTGERIPYDRVAEQVFIEREMLMPDEPIVIKVLDSLL